VVSPVRVRGTDRDAAAARARREHAAERADRRCAARGFKRPRTPDPAGGRPRALEPEIAAALYIAEPTVKTYLGRLRAKIDVRDRVRLVIFSYDTGLVTPRR
jgi:hypothetical protein